MPDEQLEQLIHLVRLYAQHHAHSPNVSASTRRIESAATKVLRRRQSLAEDSRMT